MRHSLISISDLNKDIVAFSAYSDSHTNKNDIVRMKRVLNKAVSSELTDRQRECIVMYYFEDMKMKEIATKLALSPSTVTRHIKAAKAKLKNIAKYC